MPSPRLQFTGKERDAETGLDYFLARYYSGAQGRFTSPDPENLGSSRNDPQSWNMYAYGRNNPLLYTDPFGTDYRVCDADGNNCRNLSDGQYNQYLNSIQGSNIYVTPGGIINVQNDNGSVTKIGTASWFDGDAARRAENAAGAVEWFATEYAKNVLLTGSLRLIGAAVGRGLEAYRLGQAANVVDDAAASTPVGRRGAPINVTPGTNAGAKVGDRWYTGHALDQMQGRGAVPSLIEDTMATGTKSPGRFPNTVKFSTSQADVITNTKGDVVTVIVK